MQTLKQAWWAPLAALLVISELGIAANFVVGAGTSNLIDAESTLAGVSLSLAGAILLAAGLWSRQRRRGLENALIIGGAALAVIWFWIIFMAPVALVVIVGVVVSQVRSPAAVANVSL